MKTIKDVFTTFQNSLSGLYDKHETEAITLLVINEVSKLSRSSIKAFPEKEVPAEQADQFESILAQLQTGKPVQYILGHTEFYGLDFLVNPSVLIPRPETEELVDWCLMSIRKSGQSLQQELQILDIGTGSGCIAICLKKNLPGMPVSAVDISKEALQTAKSNADANDVKISFIQADILNLEPGSPLHTPWSFIVSNPPYVTLQDKELMHTNVTDFEPHTALFVPLNDPLLFYKAIADFAKNNLVANGLLFFEINESFGHETVKLLEDKGFIDIELRKDMSDKFRMIKAIRP
ncbi:MAG: peptide chain release factor N(5)-glutamine methyltransferase [Mucilaginibacter sp.]